MHRGAAGGEDGRAPAAFQSTERALERVTIRVANSAGYACSSCPPGSSRKKVVDSEMGGVTG